MTNARTLLTDRSNPVSLCSYVPIKVDYSDLYDAMTFFRGGPDGKNGHDELGKKIGLAGKEWARDHVSVSASLEQTVSLGCWPRADHAFFPYSAVAQTRHGGVYVCVQSPSRQNR